MTPPMATVAYTVNSTIPDSAVSQFKMEEGSGTSLTNEFGSQPDATIDGATWVSDSSAVGGFKLSFDGSDDGVSVNSNYNFADLSTPFSFAVTVDLDNLDPDNVIYHFSSADQYAFTIGTPQNSSGSVTAQIVDGSNNYVTKEGTTEITTSRQRLGVAFDPVTPSIDITINGSFATLDDNADSRRNATINTQELGRQVSSNNNMAGSLDNPIWYSEILSESQFNSEYKNQPWA